MWKDFLDGLARLKESGKPFAVATVVKVSGSTYRRPGARVLITQEGVSTGLISGGCFESDLIERARQVIETQQSSLATFDTTSPDDLLFGLGLGCTGVAQILLEPFKNSGKYLEFLAHCVTNREPGVIATVFRTFEISGVSIGSRVLVQNNSSDSENIQNAEALNQLKQESLHVLQSQQSSVRTFSGSEGEFEALVEYIDLPLPLVIFGAGPDAVPLARFAKELGWKVAVVDRRPAFARKDRFPGATVLLCEPEDLLSSLNVDAGTAAVVMTHHFETDLKFLQQLLNSPAFYIGMLGPASKTDLLFQKMKDDGVKPTPEQLAKFYSPVGLDLGAETPEEIALSILAEIQAVKSGYKGGSLRTRNGPIHKR